MKIRKAEKTRVLCDVDGALLEVSGMTTQSHYTMMRALAFDFRADPAALDVRNQYMFGPAFMVCPVTRPMYYGPGSEALEGTRKTRRVYLPAGTDWYDFWTNEKLAGGRSITAKAPLETMPLYVRAGSIVPLGPVVQYTDEALDADWTIRIYPGADASFTVYEDSGDGYGYEKGQSATWKMAWKDATSTLSIGKRRGVFRGMVKTRTLRITVAGMGAGVETEPVTAREVRYTGAAMKIACR